MDKFDKLRIVIDTKLRTYKYFMALRAMKFGLKVHNGLLKDGATPEFYHQLEMVGYAMLLPIPDDIREDIITIIFLHDAREDRKATIDEIKHCLLDQNNRVDSNMIARVSYIGLSLCWLNKNEFETIDGWFDAIKSDYRAIMVKGIDHISNFGSMVGVFTQPKIIAYLDEAEKYILPAIKHGIDAYPEYEDIYRLIQYTLKMQITLVRTGMRANTQPKPPKISLIDLSAMTGYYINDD